MMGKPKIRFKGYNEDWEQRKLGEIATYRNGKAHEANQLDVGTYELVNLNSISIDGGLKPSGKFIEDGSDTLQRNDLVMVLSDVGHGDLLGRVAIIPENNRYVLNQRVALLRINDDTNTYFLFSIINRYQDYFKKLGAGSSQLNISRGIVENFEVAYPNVAEQRMIADYFQSLDHLITLHQHKCDEMKRLKKYMLQKMFPQNGKKVPEIRFDGFTNGWEQRKVSEMFKVARGYVLPATDTSQEMTDEIPYPVYSSQTKDNGLMGYYSDYLYEDAITWTTDGANAGTVNFRAGKFYCTNVCGVLLSDKIETNKVIAEALNNVAKRYVSYVGNPKLMNNVMADIQIAVPTSQKERDRISSYFSYLDHLITLHHRECIILRKTKVNDWEQRKLGETKTFFTDGNYGEAYPKSSDMVDSSIGVPFLTGGNLKDGKLDISGASYISKEKHELLTSGHLICDDIVIAVRGSLGALGYVNSDNSGWNINSQLAILRTDKEELNGKFLLQFLLSENGQKEFLRRQTGTALKQLPIGAIKDVDIPITSIDEQVKIGEYFATLDHLITLHQHKCDELQNLKKYMLQNMFV